MATRVKRELDSVLLQHIDAGYKFARWAIGHPAGAADVLESALPSLLRIPAAHRAGAARTWILGEVRGAVLRQIQSDPRGSNHRPGCGHISSGSSVSGFSDLIPPPQAASNIGARKAGIELPASGADRLRRAVADLPFEQREIVLLRDTEGLSYREITAVTGVPQATLTTRLWRARDTLEGCAEAAKGPAEEHARASALIDAYIDAEVDITTGATFVQHIAQCRHCAGRLLKRAKLSQQVRSVTVCCAPEDLCRRLGYVAAT